MTRSRLFETIDVYECFKAIIEDRPDLENEMMVDRKASRVRCFFVVR